jgi:hypothetical protein
MRLMKLTSSEVDQVLNLVQGNFQAAAKLLDLTPQQFRNTVNSRPELKAKWGKRRGRPRGSKSLPIRTHEEPPRLDFRLAKLRCDTIRLLEQVDEEILRAWLTEHVRSYC